MPGAGPPRFEHRATSGARWVVDAELAAAVEALALWDPAARAHHFAAAPGAHGRAPSAVLALPDGRRLQLRPVRRGGWLAPLWGEQIASLRRPLRELEVSTVLRARGAPVPRPLLVLGWRRGLGWSALFGSEHESGTQDGAAWLATTPPPAARAAAIDAAARAVRRFHDAGGRHADLHLGNLLLRLQPAGCDALVIDLDKARAGAPPDARRRMQELMRLYRSLCKRGFEAQVGVRGCARFLHAYCAGDRALRGALLANLPRERRRLNRHAASWALFGRG